MRIWRTGLDESRAAEYERFAREVSLPMFRDHRGFLGLLFGRNGGDAVVTTLWEDHAAADELERSTRYRATVTRIVEAGFLAGESTVERFEVHGSDLDAVI
jgi:heme-degrading monooxygenase HmoA